MTIRLMQMDFEYRRLRLLLDHAGPDGLIDCLEPLLTLAKSQNFRDIRISCRTGMSNLQTLIVREIATRHGASIEPYDLESNATGVGHVNVFRPSPGGSGATSMAYGIRLTRMDTVVEHVTSISLIFGQAMGLSATMSGHVRLCLYELAINTVEHGSFQHEAPEVRISVGSDDGTIGITYMDNAEPFPTYNRQHVDIVDKIHRGDKRGLGLFILNRLASSLAYERWGEWNVTRIALDSGSPSPQQKDRRMSMNGITIETAPCNVPGTGMIRPVGSIDSSTTSAVEKHINHLVEQGSNRIVVDFSRVDFVSSAGVGVFLGTVSMLRSKGGDLIFMKVPRHIAEVFDIINLKSYFRFVESVEELSESGHSIP